VYLENRRCGVVRIIASEANIRVVAGRRVIVSVVDHRIERNRRLTLVVHELIAELQSKVLRDRGDNVIYFRVFK